MKQAEVRFEGGFAVLVGNERSQAAVMVVAPGDKEGGPDNRHAGADQWLYVSSGRGEATVDGRTHALSTGTLLLIERGETHDIRNTGSEPLKTLSFYVPPAYTADGDPLPRGEAESTAHLTP